MAAVTCVPFGCATMSYCVAARQEAAALNSSSYAEALTCMGLEVGGFMHVHQSRRCLIAASMQARERLSLRVTTVLYAQSHI